MVRTYCVAKGCRNCTGKPNVLEYVCEAHMGVISTATMIAYDKAYLAVHAAWDGLQTAPEVISNAETDMDIIWSQIVAEVTQGLTVQG